MTAPASKAVEKPGSQPRKFETLLFLVWGLLTLYGSFYAAKYIYLIHLYGFSRVWGEHLRFTATPKGHPWLVSNGDSITGGHFLHYVITLVIWLSFFYFTAPLLHRLLPLKKPAAEL